MTGPEKPFSYRLNASLERIGWEQKDLAGELGCSDSIVSDWACGKRVPPYKTLLQVAEALGVSAYWLLFAADEYSQAMDSWERALLRAVRHLTPEVREKVRRHFEDHYAWPPDEATRPEPASPFTPEQIAERLVVPEPGGLGQTSAPSPVLGRTRRGRKGTRHLTKVLNLIEEEGIGLSKEDVEALRRVHALLVSRSAGQSRGSGGDSSTSDGRPAGTGKANGS